MQSLELFELVKQLFGRGGIVTVTFQAGNDLTLQINVPLGLGDMTSCLLQMR